MKHICHLFSYRAVLLLLLVAIQQTASGQVLPQSEPQQQEQQPSSQSSSNSSSSGSGSGNSQSSGSPLPFLDQSNETVSWDGRMWNIGNNRVFRARLEKYLSTPEADTPDDEAYRKVLEEMTQLLAPTRTGGRPNLPSAVALLPIAAQYPIDAKLCDTLANAIFGVWLAQKNVVGLQATNKAMSDRIKGEDFFNRHSIDSTAGRTPRPNNGNAQQGTPQDTTKQTLKEASIARDIAKLTELEAKIKANEAAIGASLIAAKLEYQTLIVQFAMQRRFEHVILACRIYRHLFASDPSGTLELKTGSDAEKLFTNSLGTSPTINALDAFANEMIRDVDEAVIAFDHLAARGDLASASQRISEALMVGEYLPRVRKVPMEKKLIVLDFVRMSNQLVSSMEMKDYTLAEELLGKLRAAAKDFDYSKVHAAIETARTVSDMHLNKAKVAAMQGDQKGSTEALTEAANLWPTNPKLKEFTNMIGSNADIKTQATIDLDRLLSQRNYRQIYNDQGRYLAAVMDDAERQETLKKVLTDMNEVNLTIAAANSHAQSSNIAGAWETIERAYERFPDDPEVARLRSDLSVKAADFVSSLQRAKQHEERSQTGSALSWYLKAKQQYPPSDYARQGITRLVNKLNGNGIADSN